VAKWEWCTHSEVHFNAKRPGMVCRSCAKSLAYGYEQVVHYAGEHYHLPCVLDLLPEPVNTYFNFNIVPDYP
jgi:hypothetical protein